MTAHVQAPAGNVTPMSPFNMAKRLGDLENSWVAGPGSIPRGSVKYSGLAPVPGDSSESSMVHVDDTRGQ